MVYSTSTKIKVNTICFYSRIESNLKDQQIDCYEQFSESLLNSGYSKGSVIKQTIFISVANNSEYFQSKQKLISTASHFFGEVPPTSIIPQSPESGLLMVEFVIVDGLSNEELSFRKNDDSSWLIIQHGNMKILVASGLSEPNECNDPLIQSNTAFERMQKILIEVGMNFSDVVRQWNYIEDITKNATRLHKSSQHYQIFNDVRTKFYSSSDFINGFPAATGIGMDFGGVIIDFIAAQEESNIGIFPLKNPVQLDAHKYSTDVLADNNLMCDFCKTTPKFERAKILVTPKSKWLFISGTAAIFGQKSLEIGSVEKQTDITIHNIQQLISVENLRQHGITTCERICVTYLRVYVKYKEDIEKVKGRMKAFFPEVLISYVVADICRPELLVEIEGQAEIN